MSLDHTGNRQPSIDAEEHDDKNLPVKKVALVGYLPDTDAYVRLTAVESTDDPGSYGILVLNYDGSSVSTGGGAADGAFDFMDGADVAFMDGADIAFMSG